MSVQNVVEMNRDCTIVAQNGSERLKEKKKEEGGMTRKEIVIPTPGPARENKRDISDPRGPRHARFRSTARTTKITRCRISEERRSVSAKDDTEQRPGGGMRMRGYAAKDEG